MQLVTTYRVKAYLSAAGHRLMDERLEEQRVLYNAALEERLTAWRTQRVSITLRHQSGELTAVRSTLPEYSTVNRRISVGTLERLDRAYGRYTRAMVELGSALAGKLDGPPKLVRWDAATGKWRSLFGQPRYKGAGRFRTLECHTGSERWLRRSDSGRKGYIRIKGLPCIEFRWDDRIPLGDDSLPVQPRNVKITRTPRRVTLSMAFAIGELPEVSAESPNQPVGLHPGVAQRMTAAGTDQPVVLAKRERDLRTPARLQRKMARQQADSVRRGLARWQRTATGRYSLEWLPIDPSDPGSRLYGKGYRKTRTRLAKFWQWEREADEGRLHEVSSRLALNHDAILIEVPDVVAMTRPVAGASAPPGTVAAQRNLNRLILEQTWGRFAGMLEYKAARAGIPFVRVPSQYLSQTCHRCGTADVVSRLNRARFRCVHCGYDGDAEDNAAHNVLVRGLAELGFDAGGAFPQQRLARSPTAGMPAVVAENRPATSGRGRSGE